MKRDKPTLERVTHNGEPWVSLRSAAKARHVRANTLRDYGKTQGWPMIQGIPGFQRVVFIREGDVFPSANSK